ncbi:dehydrogenase [Mesorhizobium sp. NZP2298]|uniref:dehydrogenase n=1 Tax=Mesorhizobium sp. NZP2298 TaxID=2483403 RepID=UPI0015537350|nr:dehydrogenase [Mesorhizobium sp. NZP2298]
MKLTLTLTAIAFACLMAAGCVSTRSINVAPPPPQLSEPDRALVKACLGPVRLPKGELKQGDVERLWISDRKALIDCARRSKALRDFYAERDAAIRGKAASK